jgi:hypothetical protein
LSLHLRMQLPPKPLMLLEALFGSTVTSPSSICLVTVKSVSTCFDGTATRPRPVSFQILALIMSRSTNRRKNVGTAFLRPPLESFLEEQGKPDAPGTTQAPKNELPTRHGCLNDDVGPQPA